MDVASELQTKPVTCPWFPLAGFLFVFFACYHFPSRSCRWGRGILPRSLNDGCLRKGFDHGSTDGLKMAQSKIGHGVVGNRRKATLHDTSLAVDRKATLRAGGKYVPQRV
jgi:hypothetical protein